MPKPLPRKDGLCSNHIHGTQATVSKQALTHLSAEVEPLLAWADMMFMKALEVSENFLMSTGLGTL